MAFDKYDVAEVVEHTSRVQVWRFNVYVEVDDVYVDEVDDDEYEIEVDLRATGRANVRDDVDLSRLKKGIQDAGEMMMREIDERLRQYHNRYGFGYSVSVNRFDTSDIDIDSY